MNEQGNPNTPILREVTVRNLLSFGPKGLSIELKPLNVLIGPNGAGKSNLFEVLSLLHAAPTEIAKPVREGGGIRNWLWRRDPKITAAIEAVVDFPGRQHPLRHTIEFTEVNQEFAVVDERVDNPSPNPGPSSIGSYDYSQLISQFIKDNPGLSSRDNRNDINSVRDIKVGTHESLLSHWVGSSLLDEMVHLRRTYLSISLYREWQFGRGNVLRGAQLTDVRKSPLDADLSNLGMFLNRLRQDPTTKANLIDKLSDVYEGLTDFELNFQGGSVEILFTEGDLAVPASRLSDGSLRYLCLLAILLDPEPPLLIVIEEPELGLHPDLMPKIADLLVDASSRCQLVVTTHSDVLVDALSERPDSVMVCEKHEGHTVMRRLDGAELVRWLEKYRLGQLWNSGELGGVRW